MKLNKRSKRILFIVLSLLIVIGIWIFSAVYRDTSTALQRAENFLFTRMTVVQLGEQGSTRYFYTTNRKQSEQAEKLVDRFGNERESTLKFGIYDTHVEPSVGLGMFINPSEWFQNEEIRIKNMQATDQQAFIDQLRQVVHASPQRSLLIMVHGFREAFPSALRKTAFVGHILDINTPVLLFDWPGNQGSSLRGYRSARNIAMASGAELANTLELIVRDVQPEKLWLIANSMGGEVVVHAFNHLYQNPVFADGAYEFEDVVLTAPDISHEEFDNQFKHEIAALTRHLTVYVSSNDRALVMSRIINRDPRRGESTLSPEMLDEAERLTKLIDPDSDLITLVDVTPVNRTRNFHNFSLETPEFFDDLFLRLTNDTTPHSRRIYGLQTPEGTNYWVLTPGR
jgi:esterase/lipase superfamily enzyme